jgi:PAS domain S-box-containing protein
VGAIFSKLFQDKNATTQPKAAIDALKSEIVINTISDGIACVDERGILQLFNPAAVALTGWSASDAKDLDFHSIFKFFDATDHAVGDDQNPIATALRSGVAVERRDLTLETSSKKHLQVSIKVTPIVDANNQNATESGAVIVFRDISAELKDRSEQTEFISTASHEMRTPVAIIEGYLGMLMNPATATIDARAMSYAEKAHEASKRLGRLFQDLLDVTKVDDVREHLELSLIDAGAAAAQITDQFQMKASEKGLKLAYMNQQNGDGIKSLQPVHIIYADLYQLNEILGNIIENAIKYTKQGGVAVSVESTGSRVRFVVRDTGVGIPAEDVPHLFQKFYRVDNSDTREIGGTGLGLYLIKKLAENMGGTIGVESDYGHGSTFWVEFNELTRDQAVLKAQELKKKAELNSLNL